MQEGRVQGRSIVPVREERVARVAAHNGIVDFEIRRRNHGLEDQHRRQKELLETATTTTNQHKTKTNCADDRSCTCFFIEKRSMQVPLLR